ncbi:hypothetical protein P886_4243 [Alteromonadaceae bacterium 2753L.S.0a.02]|nr:hypothetical protein P886_4243 [Alteromonadaceae bacterium 2753L.S.0a.02]
MRSLLYRTSMLIFLIVTVLLVVLNSARQKRIFILHSYNTDYAWTRELNKGIEKAMQKFSEAHINYDVRFYYMNAKNIPFETEQDARGPARQAVQAIMQYKPDTIIAFDDVAQQYVIAPRYINKPGISVVFSGVNGDETSYCASPKSRACYDTAKNVFGTLERIPVESVIDIMHLLQAENPSLQGGRVHFLLDSSTTAGQDANFLKNQDWQEYHFESSEVLETFDAWKNHIQLLDENQIGFLLVDGYRKLKMPPMADQPPNEILYANPRAVAEWTEQHTKIPIVGLNAFSSEDGFMLSVGVSPIALGMKAFDKSTQTLFGYSQKLIDKPIDISNQYIVAVNESAMNNRGLRIPNMLKVFARATDNYYE